MRLTLLSFYFRLVSNELLPIKVIRWLVGKITFFIKRLHMSNTNKKTDEYRRDTIRICLHFLSPNFCYVLIFKYIFIFLPSVSYGEAMIKAVFFFSIIRVITFARAFFRDINKFVAPWWKKQLFYITNYLFFYLLSFLDNALNPILIYRARRLNIIQRKFPLKIQLLTPYQVMDILIYLSK